MPTPAIPDAPIASRAMPESLDLDAQIAAAELRVIERDARVLHHGTQLGERLSSRSTQLRLLLAGVAGVMALVRWSRKPHKGGGARAGQAGRQAAPPPQAAVQPFWLQWLPLVLQLVASSSRPAAPPPPTGWMGWVGPLLAAGRGWAGLRGDRAGRKAATVSGTAGTPDRGSPRSGSRV